MSVKRKAKPKYRERESRIRKSGPPRTLIFEGVSFASMIEVAWANFFNELDIRWHYEPDLISLGPRARYPPDFYLPEFDCYAECKGRRMQDTDRKRIKEAADTTGKPFLLLRGSPFKAIFRPDNVMGMSLFLPGEDNKRPHEVRMGRSTNGTIAFYKPGTMGVWVTNGELDESRAPKFVTDTSIHRASHTKLDGKFYTSAD